MNRSITNIIRFLMDELLPPILRDSKLIMYPVFLIWTGGRHTRAIQLMDHKKAAFGISNITLRGKPRKRCFHFVTFYSKRDTDLNKKCLNRMRNMIYACSGTLLDVGAGKGYWLKAAMIRGYSVTACDLNNALRVECPFVNGDVCNLPFQDNAFDVVTCTHTLEHVVELERAVSELKRVAKHMIIVVVPCQRYNYLTLDGHVNFFPFKEKLTYYFRDMTVVCEKLGGDWLLMAQPEGDICNRVDRAQEATENSELTFKDQPKQEDR